MRQSTAVDPDVLDDTPPPTVELTLGDLDTVAADVETAVDATPEIDHWCSGPDWVVPVHLGFAPRSRQLLLRVDTATGPGFALLARYLTEDGRPIVAGLEPLWGFAAPLVGADVEQVAAGLANRLRSDGNWDLLLLPGMPVPSGPTSFLPRLIRGLGSLGRVNVADGIASQLADLSQGHDGWMARRSPKFRRNLRQARRRATELGLDVDDASDDPNVFDRILAIEHNSWKGLEFGGITAPEMTTTYRTMVARLAAAGRLRAHIARFGADDVGYILGGVRARTYRGLQLSYIDRVAELSVGHLLQDHQLRLLAEADEADVYDLGMDMPYKRRWADSARPSLTLVIDRTRGPSIAPQPVA